MHSSLTKIDHRPWPLPASEWNWRQSWNELLFLHYRIDKNFLQSLVPSQVKVQEFDGSSWIGIVPFRMMRVMRRPFPDVPWFSNFLELNVRFYVECNGVPGVWFLSLDATNPLVVWGGKFFFNLPYKNARMKMSRHGDCVQYISERVRSSRKANFSIEYRSEPEVFYARQGTLEHFLTERYCLYTSMRGRVYRVDVHHHPWPLQQASGNVTDHSVLGELAGCVSGEPAFLYSSGVDVVSWSPVAAY